MSTEVLYLQTGETSARQDRWLTDRIFSEGISDVGAGEFLVTQRAGGANMSVDVAAGDCVITGDSIPDQGKYQARLTQAVNLLVEAPPAEGARTDLVVFRVADSTADDGDPADDGARLQIITGEVGAGQPALPDTALPLAAITVTAGAASIFDTDLTDLRYQLQATTLKVGTQAIPLTTAERDALTMESPGDLVFNKDSGALEVSDGAQWLPQGGALLGEVTVTPSPSVYKIEFAGIPTGYDDLLVTGEGCRCASASTEDTIVLRLNNDASAYAYGMAGYSGGLPEFRVGSATGDSYQPGVGDGNSYFHAKVMDYAKVFSFHGLDSRGYTWKRPGSSSAGSKYDVQGAWNVSPAAAVTAISLHCYAGSRFTGGTFRVYGIRRAS